MIIIIKPALGFGYATAKTGKLYRSNNFLMLQDFTARRNFLAGGASFLATHASLARYASLVRNHARNVSLVRIRARHASPTCKKLKDFLQDLAIKRTLLLHVLQDCQSSYKKCKVLCAR